jgi:type I restriction enzyme M protein
MLNFDVKRKINTLRDILVGKVPDPKAQVEQITIALIYKFMDDMDLESVEFGGSREFLKEEYEKYAWTNIMQSENSGQQRANLYSEGIDKMSMNPHLPQLFRDIFRGAYVPYRDPETLNMFLKEVNDFSYDHSEDLGNAFEYLLSIMGSQGDAGQFRTPRHIIDMMVEITDPQKTDSLLDPACGTAGFLISSYKHILANNKDKDGNSTLSADDRRRMTDNFAGYDISPDMTRLSRVNMYLHKFAKPQISEYDTLTSLDKWDDTYDVILANPPFMTPKGGIIPHNRYRVSANRSEVLFVDYIAEHLNPTGKAAVIVPEGVVFQSANAYRAIRKFIIEDNLLYAVISLPSGIFNPYSGVKTSILLFDKTLAKQRDEILFVKMGNDGYDLGAQRRDVKGSDIPEIIKILDDYKNGIDVSDNSLVTIASKKDVAKQDYILVGERYKEAAIVNSDFQLVKLIDICRDMHQGINTTADKIDYEYEGIPIIQSRHITNGYLDFSDAKLVSKEIYNKYHAKYNPMKNDLLICNIGTIGKSIHIREKAEFLIAWNLFILKLKLDMVNPVFLSYIIEFLRSTNYFDSLFTGGTVNFINKTKMGDIKIPLPPLHIQEEIVKEIEGYQKIIDGAKQVVDNYKPTIKIDPSWEMVELGKICNVRDGTHDSPVPVQVGHPLITSKNLKNGTIDFENINLISEIDYNKVNQRSKVDFGDILMPMIGTIGNPVIVNIEPNFAIKNVALIKFNDSTIINDFVFLILSSKRFEKFIENTKRGGTQNFISLKDIRSYLIPHPPLTVQQKIVNQINNEISLVNQSKQLITIFEQKIKDRISEVWGD